MSFSVFSSRLPWKYLSSRRAKTETGGDTASNSVAHDFSFMSSGEPKIWLAVNPSTPKYYSCAFPYGEWPRLR